MITTTLFHRCIALRNENKRLRHQLREMKRQRDTAQECVRMQAKKNWELYKWCRTAPPEHRILEVPEFD